MAMLTGQARLQALAQDNKPPNTPIPAAPTNNAGRGLSGVARLQAIQASAPYQPKAITSPATSDAQKISEGEFKFPSALTPYPAETSRRLVGAWDDAVDRRLTAIDTELAPYKDMPAVALDEGTNRRVRELKKDQDALSQKRENSQKAQTLALYSNFLMAPDFKEFSQKGAEIENPAVSEAEGGVSVAGWRPFGKKVGNVVTYSRDNYAHIAASEAYATSAVGEMKYKYLTDDEVSIYNYLLAKKGQDSAQEFLDLMDETLNARMGGQWAENIGSIESGTGRALATGLYGVGAGLDQFKSGTSQVFSKERLPTSAMQFGSAAIREDLSGIGAKLPAWMGGGSLAQAGYDVVTTTANMAPSILLSSLTGGLGAPAAVASGVASATLGASAGGNAYNQALAEGYSSSQARNYGILVGASEGALQYALGGIGKLGNKPLSSVAQSTIQNIDSALLRVAANIGLDMASEGTEEYLQEILTPVFRNLALGENNEFKLVTPDAAYSFILGAITAGVMEGPSTISANRNTPQGALKSPESAPTPVAHDYTPEAAQAPQSATQAVTAQAVSAPANAPQTINADTQFSTTPNPSVGAADAGFVGDTVRGFSRNIATDQAMDTELREDFQKDPEMYFQLGNKETLAKAQSIFDSGLANAQPVIERALEASKNGAKLAPEMVPLSRMVANALVQDGDIIGARRILSDMAVELTQAGQLGQAAAILRNADPVSVEQTVQKALDKINEQLEKAGRDKKWKAELTDAEIQQIYETDFTQEGAFEAIYDQIAQRLGADMGSSLWEKLTEVRRIAMLLNPKTQVRNVVGNVPLAVERKVAERISGAVQGALVKIGIMDAQDRTRTARVSKESKDIARQLYEQNIDFLKNSGNKWDMNNMLREYRKYFGDSAVGQAADAVRTFTYQLLEMGDTPFLRSAFVDSAAQYIQAQGYTSLEQVPQKVIDFATQNALEATFRDSSALAQFINQVKAKGGVAGGAVDILFPFVSTPVNIARRTIDYSPAGLIKAISDARQGRGAAVVVDDLSKAFTGTAVFALGFLLRKLGAITGGPDDDRDKRAFDRATGESPYSFLGKIAYEWMQPFGSQLAAGAEIYDAIREEPSIVNAVLQGLYAGGDTILNMTVFQNILDILKGYGSPTENVITEIMTSGVSQFAPSMFGALARTIDDTVRSSYTGEGAVKDTIAQTQAKTPFASQGLPASVDIWGIENKRVENPFLRGMQEFLNPANINMGQETDVDKKLSALYDATGDKSIFPQTSPYRLDSGPLKGESMTGWEREQFQKTQGQSAYALMDEFMASDLYGSLTDAQKVDVLSDINAFSKDKAMRELVESRGMEYSSDWDDEMALSDFSAYQAYKTALSDAKKGENYEILDVMLSVMNAQPKDVQEALLDLDGMNKLSQAFKVGLTSEQYYDLNDQWRIINAKDKTATEKSTEFAVWLEGRSELSQRQRMSAKDFMKFYSIVPASAAQYEKLRQNGLSTKTAEKIYSNISNLLPEKGEKEVSNTQKYNVILTSGLPEKDQRAALKVYMPEATYEKMESAFDLGVGTKLFVDFHNKKSELTGSGEIKAPLKKWALQNGMTTKQFNKLWDLYYPKK